MDVELTTRPPVPPDKLAEARARLESLERHAGRPLTDARLTLRRPKKRYFADADVHFDGRHRAAHADGRTPAEAVDAVVERLLRQLRRVADAPIALRNDPRVVQAGLEAVRPGPRRAPEAGLKPPEEREIVRRRTYAAEPQPTLTAIADMLDLDEHFHLFRHVRAPEDVVVYRRDDGAIGLIHPQGSILADENDVVEPQPSRYSEPLTLEAARAEEDMLNHRFLYFTDADDGRGKVLYLRHDGDYGLVEPE
jgi:ribosome-associated translation inhibitor RaiA